MPLTHSATAAMPAFPGRQYRAPSWVLCLSFQHSECSAHAGGRTKGCERRSASALEARAAVLQKCRGLDHGLPGTDTRGSICTHAGAPPDPLPRPPEPRTSTCARDKGTRVRLQFCLRSQRMRDAKSPRARLADAAAGAAPGPEPAGSSCPRSTSVDGQPSLITCSEHFNLLPVQLASLCRGPTDVAVVRYVGVRENII